MTLWNRYCVWRAFRRQQRHIRWLRKARVMLLPPPDIRCERNKTECV